MQGERTGAGIYYYANGNKYVGNFKDGMQHGKGVLLGQMVQSMTANGKITSVTVAEPINGMSVIHTKANGKTTSSMVREL